MKAKADQAVRCVKCRKPLVEVRQGTFTWLASAFTMRAGWPPEDPDDVATMALLNQLATADGPEGEPIERRASRPEQFNFPIYAICRRHHRRWVRFGTYDELKQALNSTSGR